MALVLPTRKLDRVAITLSGLCAVHCLATSLLVALVASIGGLLAAPWIHEAGLCLAILLGAAALGQGLWRHGLFLPAAVGGLGLGVMAGALRLPDHGAEAMVTIAGAALLALGHYLNRRALG